MRQATVSTTRGSGATAAAAAAAAATFAAAATATAAASSRQRTTSAPGVRALVPGGVSQIALRLGQVPRLRLLCRPAAVAASGIVAEDAGRSAVSSTTRRRQRRRQHDGCTSHAD